MAKIVMTTMSDGGVYKAFLTQSDLDAATRIVQSSYTIVDLADADLIKVFEEKATFKVTDGVLGVQDISPTHSKETYQFAKKKILNTLSAARPEVQTSLDDYLNTIRAINIDSLTIDPATSFAEYVKSINNNVYYDHLQID
mgnify:FL=1|jgi:hypothetical protein|tara:strand:+ start:70 stop:492 length:423 start_codon:yes stop_codon:yes gene_type:complete